MTNKVTPVSPVWFDGEPISAVKAFKKVTHDDKPLSESFNKLTEFKNPRTVHEVYELADSMRKHPAMVNANEIYAVPVINARGIRVLDEVLVTVVFSEPVDLENLATETEEFDRVYKEVDDVAFESFHSLYPEDITEKYRVEKFSMMNSYPQDIKYNEDGLATQASYLIRAHCVAKNASGDGWAFIAVNG